ncbi:hypothetical protein IWX91DRAFT_110775 [Phyllosticta citricarpa]
MTGDPNPWKDLQKLDTSGISVNLIDFDGPENAEFVPQVGSFNTLQRQNSLLDVDIVLPTRGTSRQDQEFSDKQTVGNGGSEECGDSCESCNATGCDISYCNVCNFVFCTACWNQQLAHKRGRLAFGGIPHEKTRAEIAMKVIRTLNPPTEPRLRQKLHLDDTQTAWFGIQRPDFGRATFQDYGRFSDLMRSTKASAIKSGNTRPQDRDYRPSIDQRTPSLVSFIGETGHGKSTLVKLLIDLQASKADVAAHPTPVVGESGVLDPTSSDVHLYCDPSTEHQNDPILFADCEGLTGGSRPPVSAMMKTKFLVNDAEEGIGSNHAFPLSSREITWDCSSREAAVAQLYPRLLYTFSDVVVFVLKNHRVVENVLEKLVAWAAAALETSSNQPVLPHAILALNAEDYNINESLWEVEAATADMLKSLAKTVDQNRTFKQAAQYWLERDRKIETVEQLMLCYYGSIQVIRIPKQGRPQLIQRQVGTLHNAIREACLAARHQRADLRMLLDVNEFQCYLECAFDHFARELYKPFDFVQASRLHSPIPFSFGGNILKLALKMAELWRDKTNAKQIFDEIRYVVASAIMFDVTRTKKRGRVDTIFPQYIEQLDSALETFCNIHWPCEYVAASGARCVNVRSGHSKGHQTGDGRVLAAGDYVSQFSFHTYHQQFKSQVYFVLTELWETLDGEKKHGNDEKEAAAQIHQRQILAHFYRRCAQKDAGCNFISHTACFCCLFEMPEHSLPCGHIICTSCVKTYGIVSGKNELTIQACPLCSNHIQPSWSHKIALKPKAAGVRILSLDGGGVRGIIELEVLWQIEQALGGKLPIQRFFDLIVGTSSGGLVALGLAAKEWSVENCINRFESLCKKAFTRRTGGNLPLIGWYIENYYQSMYETQPFQFALMEAFGKDEYLFGGRRAAKQSSSNVKVAVITTSAVTGIPVVVSNYNRPSSGKLSYHFQRAEDSDAELKIWEAARCTSAAPRYFKSFDHKASQQVYLDGAIYHNNPITIAERERKLIWPTRPSEPPDMVLSIGTGSSLSMNRQESPVSPSVRQGGVIEYPKRLFRILRGVLGTSLDCERIWNEFLTGLPDSSEETRFIRINPELKGTVPQLDAVDQMKPLQNLVRNEAYVPEQERRYRHIAMRLVATCFYFELDEGIDSNNVARGNILCRFEEGSVELHDLGQLLAKWSYQSRQLPTFVINEQNSGVAKMELSLNEQVIGSMMKQLHFRMPKVLLHLSSKWAMTEMHLDFGEDEIYPLSGFPRPLFDEQQAVSRSLTMRRPGRFQSRLTDKQSSTNWIPPMATTRQHESLASYRDTNPQLGIKVEDASDQAREASVPSPRDYLQRAQQLLRHLVHRKSKTNEDACDKEVASSTTLTTPKIRARTVSGVLRSSKPLSRRSPSSSTSPFQRLSNWPLICRRRVRRALCPQKCYETDLLVLGLISRVAQMNPQTHLVTRNEP